MSFKYQDEIDMNLFASILKDAVSKVKTEEDPEVLTDLKKQFKKNVPFTLRMYVCCCLSCKTGYDRQDRRLQEPPRKS